MLNMGIEDVVAAFVESMLPRFSSENRVLTMSLGLSVRRKGEYDKHGVSRTIHLMFHRPHNYTKALWNVSEDWDSYRHYLTWQLKSDHDSCWRSSGFGDPFYKLAQELANKIRPKTEWHDVSASIIFRHEPKIVELKSWKFDRDKRLFTVEYIPNEK
jgi:hypothetical protein